MRDSSAETEQSDDRVAIITGGGSGIGAETARLFSSKGVGVAIVGRTAAKLELVVSEIEASGGRAWAVPADLAERDAPQDIVDTVVQQAGRLDVIALTMRPPSRLGRSRNSARVTSTGTPRRISDRRFS